jgi:hypothetical protein
VNGDLPVEAGQVFERLSGLQKIYSPMPATMRTKFYRKRCSGNVKE